MITDDYGYAQMYTDDDQYLVSYDYASYDTYQSMGSKIYYNSKYNIADDLFYMLQYSNYNPSLKTGDYYNYWANNQEWGDYSTSSPFNFKESLYDSSIDGAL
jgi:hypothetical protein